jgi:hypothetical protein
MYYYCAKLNAFALPAESRDLPAGGIIAASAVPCGMLQRRSFMAHKHLRHRMFDPQLYLSTLDPLTAANTVYKLATYEWFGADPVAYDSGVHRTHAAYKLQESAELLAKWPRQAPTTEPEILNLVRKCLAFQLEIGCEALIAPSPLTNHVTDYELEGRYLDATCAIVRELQLAIPVYATAAISDNLLLGTEAEDNPLVRTIGDQVAARPEINGLYLVIEQTADHGYVCRSQDVLKNILVLTDDIVTGARKRVAINYLGNFGSVTSALGAEIWCSGHYRSQRRMRIVDQDEGEGRAYPRFYSSALAGDIGLAADLPLLRAYPVFRKIFSRTVASQPLLQALNAGTYPASAPQWEYRSANVWTAAAHYNDIAVKLDARFDSQPTAEKLDLAERWLEQACEIAQNLIQLGVDASYTDVRHQTAWLAAFQGWREYAGR